MRCRYDGDGDDDDGKSLPNISKNLRQPSATLSATDTVAASKFES